MLTGYTSKVGNGQTFEEFVWGCARAFGALVMMRDDPTDGPIPKAFTPSPYYDDALAKEREILGQLRQITVAEAEHSAAASYTEVLTRYEQEKQESNDLAAKYAAMIAKVEAWIPPTADHVKLRNFMLQQLRESVTWDCFEPPSPRRRSGSEWLTARIGDTERRITYYLKEAQKERERTDARNQWLAELRLSLKAYHTIELLDIS